MNLYYLSSDGNTKIDLNSDKIICDEPEKLLESEWKYTTTSTLSSSATLDSTYKEPKEFQLTLKICADSENEFNKLMKQIANAFDSDTANRKQGKLYWNECYRNVVAVKRTHAEYCPWAGFVELTVTFLALNPDWIKEVKYSILPTINSESLTLPLTLPVILPIGSGNKQINIDNYSSSDFVLTAYGPTTGVNVEISDNHYIVDHAIESGEYLTIDSRETAEVGKQCYLTKADHTIANCFNDRRSGYQLFNKIPAGSGAIVYSGSYGIELTIFVRTGDPAWT